MDEPVMGPEEIARLRNQLAQLQRQLAAVQLIAERLSAITQVEDTTREALRLCLEIAEADAGSLVLYDPHAGKLVYRQVIGQAADEITGLQLDTDQGIAGQVFRSGTSLITEDVSREQSHLHDIDERTGYVTQNMVSVPLKSVAGEPIGVLQVLNRHEGAFGEEDVRLIEIMGSEIAAAIESARLAEEARLGVIMRFIGDLSHDVKNMISPVQMGAETLREFAQEAFDRLDALGVEHGPDWTDRLGVALGELREMLPELVEMMIDGSLAVQERMAQISAAVKGLVSQPHFEATDLPEIAERVVALLQNNAQSQGVTLSLEAPESLTAEVDRKQIYNAIYNLIFNALDACGPGATVTFRLYQAPEGGVVLECADTGPGMPPEVKARAFTDNAISTKVGGTGLGTKIVGDVVRAHAGEISVESEIGQGTTIRCRLPVSH